MKLIFVLLLVLYVSGNARAEPSRCMSDKVTRKLGRTEVAVLRQLPGKEKNGAVDHYAVTAADEDIWAPIRVHVSSADLADPTKYCTVDGENKNEQRPDFWGGHRNCRKEHVLTEEKKSTLLERLVPEIVKLHSDRLLVQPHSGAIVLPDLSQTACKHFTIPAGHTSSGVSNADIVLYVAATPWVTAAKTCATQENGRPVAVGMTFPAEHIALTHTTVRNGAHHLAHALGFNYETMNARGMIRNVSGIRGKKNDVSVVVTDKTKEKVRRHYNCSTAEGMELEDEGHSWSDGAHWERRNAKDDIMNMYTDIGLYTAITMAFFEDLKYFKANWGMEEHMSWGFNAGCDLLDKKCIENGRNMHRNMFCTEEKSTFSCTSDRLHIGKCRIDDYKHDALDSAFKYFSTRNYAGDKHSLTDYCPIISADRSSCTNHRAQDHMKATGSRVGENSRCLHGDSLEMDGVGVGDVCAEVKCNGEDNTVEVRYLGDDAYYKCPEGSSIEPTKTFSYGRIICPKYEEVCTVGDNGESLVARRPFSTPTKPAPKPDEETTKEPKPAPKPDEDKNNSGKDGNKRGGQNDGAARHTVFQNVFFVCLFVAGLSVLTTA